MPISSNLSSNSPKNDNQPLTQRLQVAAQILVVKFLVKLPKMQESTRIKQIGSYFDEVAQQFIGSSNNSNNIVEADKSIGFPKCL